MELRPGLNRIGNDIVACYLVSDETGITLIDAGIPGQWKDFLAELDAMDRKVDDVKGVILTHGDSDHIGFAERLRKEHGIPVYVHEADAARARGEAKGSASWGGMRLGATAKFLWYAGRRGGLKPVYVSAVMPIEAGVTLPLPGSPVIVAVPGHSPGSIAIHVPAVDAIFVGDALTTRNVLTGVEGPAPAPFTDDPAEALEVLDHISGLGATWVLPGHGAPWSGGVEEAVRRVRAAAPAKGDQRAA